MAYLWDESEIINFIIQCFQSSSLMIRPIWNFFLIFSRTIFPQPKWTCWNRIYKVSMLSNYCGIRFLRCWIYFYRLLWYGQILDRHILSIIARDTILNYSPTKVRIEDFNTVPTVHNFEKPCCHKNKKYMKKHDDDVIFTFFRYFLFLGQWGPSKLHSVIIIIFL